MRDDITHLKFDRNKIEGDLHEVVPKEPGDRYFSIKSHKLGEYCTYAYDAIHCDRVPTKFFLINDCLMCRCDHHYIYSHKLLSPEEVMCYLVLVE